MNVEESGVKGEFKYEVVGSNDACKRRMRQGSSKLGVSGPALAKLGQNLDVGFQNLDFATICGC